MKRNILIILVFAIITFNPSIVDLTIVNRDQIQPRETSTCEERQSPGPICESCELLSTCVKHSNGWTNIPIEACDTQNGFYCNALLASCSNMTGPCHPLSSEGNFPCTSHGVFPDPYDCQKYHMCYYVGPTLVSAKVDCHGNKAFNPTTGQCSLTIKHSICHEKQFKCLNAGDVHAWPMSQNIFYICKATSNQDERILYPTLYRCADGEIFDGYYCRPANPNDQFPNNLTTDSIGPTASSPISEITKPTIANTTSRMCSKAGLFADTKDCHKYYYCSPVSGVLKQMECPVDTYFNEVTLSCTFGNC